LKNPRLAALLSFLFPGLGQMYNGQKLRGALFSVVNLINMSLIALEIGIVMTPVFWLYAVYDAYRVADMMLPEAGESASPGQHRDGPDETN
jgi:TM2 domain-containing membrane protein YozV